MSSPVDEFLSVYSPPVQEIALAARGLVLSVMPDVVEQVDKPARLLGYGTDTTYKGTICVISPYTNHVNLGFAHGKSLPDPSGLLEGTGKRARHVKLKTLDAVENPALRTLLEAALDHHLSSSEGSSQEVF